MVFVIAIGDDCEEVEKTKGSMICLSPLEMVHALFLRVADAIDSGADQSELRMWRKLMLTSVFAFEKIPNEEQRRWRHEGTLTQSQQPLAHLLS